MASKFASKKGVSPKKYLKKHPTPTILHFQPTEFVEARTSAELREWEALVISRVGLKGIASLEDGEVSYTGTKCGDPTGIDYFDDCESD